jgi:EAL domain-containing protein (putative c-di-GMP-specific phosphodiesterase class I)
MSKHEITDNDLAGAIERDEFVFFYQAKVSMLTGEICGAEALIRWLKPDDGITLPDDFIPLAETSGFITRITGHMFRKLLTDLRLIHDVNKKIDIAFNASTHDFETPAFSDAVCSATQNEIIGPGKIEIEVTEASLLSDDIEIHRNLCMLPERGVPLTMDDFGQGFSSIDLLGKCPFTAIKLDKEIVQRMRTSPKDLSIIQSSIRMAHKLRVDVIAEGIEDWSTYNFLLNSGCTHAQGYLISHPVPLLEFLNLLRNHLRWPALPVGLLYMAELDHIEWRKALMDAVFTAGFIVPGDSESSRYCQFPELDHTKCRLGRWFYGQGRQQYAGIAEFDALEQPHRNLHDTGRLLLNAVHDQASEEEIMELMRNVSERSATIVELLQKLQNEAISVNGWPQIEAFKEFASQRSHKRD